MEGSSSYTSLYIFNRLLSSTVTDGTNTAGLASYTYDGKAPVNVTGMTAHDPALYDLVPVPRQPQHCLDAHEHRDVGLRHRREHDQFEQQRRRHVIHHRRFHQLRSPFDVDHKFAFHQLVLQQLSGRNASHGTERRYRLRYLRRISPPLQHHFTLRSGYELETLDRFAEPEETLDDTHREITTSQQDPAIGVLFKDSSGIDCGRYVVKLRGARTVQDLGYLVDNSNLADLLRLIGTCAARKH